MTDYSAFPRIEGLVDLACRNGVDVRPTLLRVLTDLYVQTRSHTPAEEAQYVELALRLIESVDAATRTVVAARLATYPRAPTVITQRLRELAGPISEPAAAPAAGVDNETLRDAFFAAKSFERHMILTNLDARDGPAPRRQVAAAVETCRRLEAAVLDGKREDFARLLESALILPRAVAERIAGDSGGEPIVVAARALGMTSAALHRVLLLLNPSIGRSVQRVYELAALYDELSPHAAESMIDIWRGRAATRPAHQSTLWNDEQRSSRAAATPSRYQHTRRSDALAAQFRNSGR